MSFRGTIGFRDFYVDSTVPVNMSVNCLGKVGLGTYRAAHLVATLLDEMSTFLLSWEPSSFDER